MESPSTRPPSQPSALLDPPPDSPTGAAEQCSLEVVPTVFLDSDPGPSRVRLKVLDVVDDDSEAIECLAATIGALAEQAPVVWLGLDESSVAELLAVHEVVESVVVDAGLTVVDHESFAEGCAGWADESPGPRFCALTIEAGDLVGSFQLQAESGIPPQLFKYWAHGEGADKIRWGSKGDFTRCVGFLRKYVDQDAEGTCANLHRDATGKWPGERPQSEGTAVEIMMFADEAVTVADVIEAEEAADRIRNGKPVALSGPDAILAVEALAADTEPSDLTLLTVVGTRHFASTAHNSLTRDKMPQIPADRLAAFRQFLTERSVRVLEIAVDPLTLRATQNELDARKVGKFVQSARTGSLNGDAPMWISEDLRILDGHSRWAAFALLAAAEDPFTVDVIQAILPMSRLLDLARRFNELDGIESRAHGELRFDPNQPRHPSGDSQGGQWAPRAGGRSGEKLLLSPDQGASSPNQRQVSLRDLHGLGRRAPMIQAKPADLDTPAARLYGSGDIDAVFNGAEITTVPFRSASRRKDEPLFDREVVEAKLAEPTRLREIDPRTLHGIQRQVTRDGVQYYLGDEYRQTGLTYADRDQPSNKHPIAYRNPRTDQWVLLAGHHRATADLILGRPTEAIVIPNRTIVVEPEFAVVGDATVPLMYRDISNLLAVDESNDAALTVEQAIEAISALTPALVASDEDATAVLHGLGIRRSEAGRLVRWAHGTTADL
jgi:hypothetical protein